MIQIDQEILKLIYQQVMKEKLTDKQLIEQIVAIYLRKYKDLIKYLENIVFKPQPTRKENFTPLMGYVESEKTIYIFEKNLQKTLEEEIQAVNLNTIERKFYTSSIITQRLLHEIDHAIQAKRMNELPTKVDKLDIETELLRIYKYDEEEVKKAIIRYKKTRKLYDKNKIKEKRELYLKYYSYDLLERQAQIYSLTMIKKMITPLKEQLPNLYKIELYQLLEESLTGYEEPFTEIKSPTLEHLKALNYLDKLQELEIYHTDYQRLITNMINQYSLKTRLNLGLPLKETEYKVLKRTLHSIKNT